MCVSYLLGVLCFSYMFYSCCSFPCDILTSRYKRKDSRSYIVTYMSLQANTNIASGRGLNGEVGTFLVPNFDLSIDVKGVDSRTTYTHTYVSQFHLT